VRPGADIRAYRDNFEHLEDELRVVDLLLRLRIDNQSLQNQAAPEAQTARAVYISSSEVEFLLSERSEPGENPRSAETVAEWARLRAGIEGRIASSREERVFLALPELCELFGLSTFESQAIMICLAPELRRKYDRLYAYAQDDITRKRPSVDLVLELLCDTEADRWKARSLLADGGTLLRGALLQKIDDPHSPSGSSGLAQLLRVDPRICAFLLGNNQIDARLAGEIEVLRPAREGGNADSLAIDEAIVAGLSKLAEHQQAADKADRRKLILQLHGPAGVGKRKLALHLCGHLNCALLCIDANLLVARGPQAESLLQAAFREALLQHAALYLQHADALLAEGARPLLNALNVAIAEYGWLVFLSAAGPWTQRSAFPGCLFHSTPLPIPDVPARASVWKRALEGETQAETWADQLAAQFRLTPGQIRAAVEFVRTRGRMEGDDAPIALRELAAACRLQSSGKLRQLAVKIEPHYGWNDIVLPPDKIAHLREICSHVRYRFHVFGKWGFGKKVGHGKGLSVLFTGPSGTGKTMAAEVLARDLELELYRVDLASVVSKYIGETEKNLANVFAEAETSNAILFFDEADALFGKRTEVSDAHDRYANVETSYLLQKMEEYEGVVIMATNLRDNMDEAFTRRVRFIVEFPFPDEANCLRIWQTHFPASAPVSSEIDYAFLARELRLPGGNIKNIVLSAAFMAAENGGTVRMEHILHGSRREYEKMGKLWRQPAAPVVSHGGDLL
jgi:AAA+ superfamily predicted ATPase